jgi:CO/xanthine dehydrogenase Mo-binding subunit
MNANTEFSRRSMLQSTGAVVIAFSMGGTAEALAQTATPAGRPPLVPTELDSWLAIARDGSVTIYFGKIDGGQGTDLAIAQIVADELDVPMRSVSVVQGDTGLTVNQGGASGSTGVRFGGAALRQAGAEARRVLLTRAAEKLGVAVDRLTVAAASLGRAMQRRKSAMPTSSGQYFHPRMAGTANTAIRWR